MSHLCLYISWFDALSLRDSNVAVYTHTLTISCACCMKWSTDLKTSRSILMLILWFSFTLFVQAESIYSISRKRSLCKYMCISETEMCCQKSSESAEGEGGYQVRLEGTQHADEPSALHLPRTAVPPMLTQPELPPAYSMPTTQPTTGFEHKQSLDSHVRVGAHNANEWHI